MVNVLTSMEAANILTNRVIDVNVPPIAEVSTIGVPTVSRVVPTIRAIFTTASVVTLYSRRPREISAKDKGNEKMVESDTPKKKKLQEHIDVQVAREIEEEMARDNQRMNEQIARDAEIAKIHAEEELKMMIDGLDRSNEIIAKHLQDMKNLKQNYEEEDINEMMQLVPVKEVYVEALQVKHPIIDWEIHFEGQRDYWKIIRLGGHTTVYQFFVDMLKQFDKEDLNQLWTLVKETLSIRQALSDKEKELWVELKRLFEPDFKDQLWTHTQNLMHDPLECRLYDTCGVHHVFTKDQEIFMLVKRDYLLRRGLAIVMISNKLQMKHQVYWRIVRSKMLKSFPLPVTKIPLLEYFATASEEVFPLLIQTHPVADVEVVRGSEGGSGKGGHEVMRVTGWGDGPTVVDGGEGVTAVGVGTEVVGGAWWRVVWWI
nr:hypothetical protein [Tanacetum cinerariifolium]